MFGVIVGIAIGYLFKPQIDTVINKIRKKIGKKETTNWDD